MKIWHSFKWMVLTTYQINKLLLLFYIYKVNEVNTITNILKWIVELRKYINIFMNQSLSNKSCEKINIFCNCVERAYKVTIRFLVLWVEMVKLMVNGSYLIFIFFSTKIVKLYIKIDFIRVFKIVIIRMITNFHLINFFHTYKLERYQILPN